MSIAKKISLCALLSTVAIIFGYIEFLFPIPMPIPAIKLGLGNIVILISLYCLSKKATWCVMLIKVVVTSLLFASPSVFIYSLLGGIFSLIFMQILKAFDFNIITVSIGGGIFHNLGQLLAAAVVLMSPSVFIYLPVLILSGGLAATITGIIAKIIVGRIKAFLEKN